MVLSDMVRCCVRNCVEELCWLYFVPCEQSALISVCYAHRSNDSILLGIAGKLLMRRDNTLHLIKGIV
jgi:hypothetical protein